MFKIVCINAKTSKDVIGAVHECSESGNPRYYRFKCGAMLGKEDYLKLPTEPKTCADMTMEEWLAMCCLRSVSPRSITWCGNQQCQRSMNAKDSVSGKYFIVEPKSPREIEIERLIREMHKLADAIKVLQAEED